MKLCWTQVGMSGFFAVALSGAGAVCAAQNLAVTATSELAPAQPDARIAATLGKVSADAVRADITKLVTFGTRSTLSSEEAGLPAGQGLMAAAAWVESEFRAISATCGGCLEVKRDEFTETPASGGARFAKPTRMVNVYAVLHGTAKDAPWVLVTGHMDSRVNDVMDARGAAPGANDDASGVAVSLESARAIAAAVGGGLKLPGTIVFVGVDGEEQGLNGSKHLAKLAKAEGWPLEAVLNNDIVGGDTTPGASGQDKTAVRVFSESVSSAATPEQVRQQLGLGAENDSPSRELSRTIAELAPAYFGVTMEHAPPAKPGTMRPHYVRMVPAFHPVPVQRRDRYLRGGDHTSFNAEGFAAVRFTEWRENFDHQHQSLRTEGGVEYGDLLKFVDFDYVANVARMNAMTLLSLASAPGEPRNVRVLTKALDNNTDLAWDPPAFAPPGTMYEVVWRDTTAFGWQHAAGAGTSTLIHLDVSKDNVLFGVRAVDAAGHRGLPVAPVPGR